MARSNGVDVDDMSLKELTSLLALIQTAIPERKKMEAVELRAKLGEIAADAGYTLDEIVRGRRVPAASASVKYRNPDNPAETWSGRGRPARWLTEKLKKRGAKREDFAV